MPAVPVQRRLRAALATAAATAAAAGMLAACGSPGDNAPDLNTALPTSLPTAAPLPSATPTPTPTRTAAPTTTRAVEAKPVTARPAKRVARPAQTGSASGSAGPGWRAVGGDEFNGPSLDTAKWQRYDGPGGFGNGYRKPETITQSGGDLVITASGEDSGGMADSFGQLYGRWEFRARTDKGRGFGSAILLWPDDEDTDHGEIDISEVPGENRDVDNVVLHSGPGGDTLAGTTIPGDFSQWHTFAVDWLPDSITWYVDGRQVYKVTDKSRIPTRPMHLAIQLDMGPVKDWMPAPDDTTPKQVRLQVDWVHVYAPADAPTPTSTAASTG